MGKRWVKARVRGTPNNTGDGLTMALVTRLGRERGWPPMTREQFDGMRSPAGSLVLGAPDTVAAKILRWREILGIERFMLHGAGTVPHHLALRSIELLGTKVAPVVRGA